MAPTLVGGRGHRTAKYSLPPQPPDYLRRARLLDFLHQNVHRKLILILAAAGYGKTALVADFAHDTDLPVAWLRLDDTDRDLAALAGDIVTALQHTFPGFESVIPALAARSAAGPDELASALNHEIETGLDRYFVLALDDFQLVEDAEPIIRFFDALVDGLPQQAHLLILGRTLPAFRIAALAAAQQVAGLSEEHLRFTPEEVQALIQLRNRLALPDDEAETLVSSTEGWITGILLTTQLMWQGLIANLVQARQSESPLYDYLAAEVLDQQPASLRQFMLEAAVLPDMEPNVCDAVLGRADSADLLKQVEARRLFVNVVGEEFRAYQYHNLFRDFLLARLRARDPERLRVLQIRAAEWYSASGMAEAAVTFYVAARALSPAAQLVEAQAKAMYDAGRHVTLRHWAEQLAAIAHEVPTLYLYLSKADADAGDLADAEVKLATATEGFARRKDAAGELRTAIHRGFLLYRRGQFENALTIAQAAAATAQAMHLDVARASALLYSSRCQTAVGRMAAAEESLRQAIQLLQSPADQYDLAVALGDLAIVLRARGQTARAAQAQQKSLALWRELSAPGPLGLALNNIGWDLHMLGQYESALTTYADALEWAKRAGSARLEAMIITGQGDVFADLGDPSAAGDYYREAMKKAERAGDWALSAYLFRAMARLDRASGNYVGALEWLRRATLASGEGQAESALANVDGLRGIILVEMGHIRDGRQTLERVCADLDRSGVLVDLAQNLLFRACGEFRDGDPEAAAQSLTRALAISEHVGYDQMLVSEALAARDLLEANRRHPRLGSHVSGLLARAETFSAIRARLKSSTEAGLLASATPPPVPAAALDIRALGAGRILNRGEEIPRAGWETQVTRELLLFLVDQAPVARDRVLQTFWPDKPLARASANLHQTLYRLRRAIGYEAVIVEDQTCRLAPDLSLHYDVERFEAKARAALALPAGDLRRAGALATAVARYTGDYLSDVAAEWVLNRRKMLSDLYVQLLAAHADELMGLTRYSQARDALTKAIAVDHLRDDLHQRMLICLARLGRRHEVVDYYRRYREALRAELGLDPPPEIRALYAQLIQ
jgi:ATP/maltotriose-dependent transcriptional regulator MalT/DNA-binding SARP family transcriptional activator